MICCVAWWQHQVRVVLLYTLDHNSGQIDVVTILGIKDRQAVVFFKCCKRDWPTKVQPYGHMVCSNFLDVT